MKMLLATVLTLAFQTAYAADIKCSKDDVTASMSKTDDKISVEFKGKKYSTCLSGGEFTNDGIKHEAIMCSVADSKEQVELYFAHFKEGAKVAIMFTDAQEQESEYELDCK